MIEVVLWLFPATYLLHIAEEGFAGERFYRWIGRVTGRYMSAEVFFRLNAAFFAVMVGAILLVPESSGLWLMAVLGTITLANGLGHLAGTALTRRYSPGTVTGAFLWIPLGALALVVSHNSSSRPVFVQAFLVGILLTALVFLLAFAASRIATPG